MFWKGLVPESDRKMYSDLAGQMADTGLAPASMAQASPTVSTNRMLNRIFLFREKLPWGVRSKQDELEDR